MKTTVVATGLLAGLAAAQRPANTTICDYYTAALLGNNTAAHQATVLTLLVNTVVIGNYTKPTIPGVTWPDIAVAGILDPKATYKGDGANLLPYFDGGLASSNRGGSSGVAVNFLDDGGATPLLMNMPANGTMSNQYKLLTHLYEYFGTVLGCSAQGTSSTFANYSGSASMYSVHKYMALNSSQVGYFIEQVGLAAASFGVSDADVTYVGTALAGLFDVRCAAATTVIPAFGPQLQSICTTEDCMMASNASSTCPMAVVPGIANSTLAMGEGNATSTATSVDTSAAASATGSSSSTAASASSSKTASSTATKLAGSFSAAGVFAAAIAFFL